MNSRQAGATTVSTSIVGRLSSWFDHHRRIAIESLAALLASWVSSLMTWLVIGIALALPGILYLMLTNIAEVSGDWDGKPRISLYLSASIDERAGRDFAAELTAEPDVMGATYVSSADALIEFQRMSGFGDVLNSLDRNPLPGVVNLTPVNSDIGRLKLQVAQFNEDDRVESVVFDLEWIERLHAMIQFGERLVMALAFVLSLGVLLVIGNTIRLSIENRRSEIEIVKLVGGTDRFVRRPFLYLGFWYGVGGALMALILIEASVLFLATPVEALAQSYRDEFALSGPDVAEVGILFLTGTSLGIMGAVTAVGRHLKDIEPQ